VGIHAAVAIAWVTGTVRHPDRRVDHHYPPLRQILPAGARLQAQPVHWAAARI